MVPVAARWAGAVALAGLAVVAAVGCESGGRDRGVGAGSDRLGPEETFRWVRQPVAFMPPAGPWERQGDNGGGTLGVRFILRGGGGQCITVAAYRLLADRDRREAIEKLIAGKDSLSRREFLSAISLARARTEDPISEREAAAAMEINAMLDRAMTDYLSENPVFVGNDLAAALRAASSYEPTLEEILPRVRLYPERMQEPERWKIAYERDTTLAGHPAFASDDTLFTPERPLLFRQIFWVVRGCAFKAEYQGTDENLGIFARVVDSIRFPEAADVAAQ